MTNNLEQDEVSIRSARVRRRTRLAVDVLSGFHDLDGGISPTLRELAILEARKHSRIARSRLLRLIG